MASPATRQRLSDVGMSFLLLASFTPSLREVYGTLFPLACLVFRPAGIPRPASGGTYTRKGAVAPGVGRMGETRESKSCSGSAPVDRVCTCVEGVGVVVRLGVPRGTAPTLRFSHP